jgi:hypothetical protein
MATTCPFSTGVKFINSFLLFVVLVLPPSLYAQSQKDTENWLVYNLNNTCGSTYSRKVHLDSIHVNQGYNYTTYIFSVVGNKLFCTWNKFRYQPNSKVAVLLDKTILSMNLSKLKTVQQTSSKWELRGHLWLNFVFDDNSTFADPPVRFYKGQNKRDVTSKTNMPLTIMFEAEVSASDLEADLPNRIVKAILHLAELNNAPVVKDVF